MGNFWLFLLQLGVILGFSCLVGAAFRRIGQPQVVGEMAAGFALGPTVFGAIAPQAFRLIFPPESLAILTTFAQAGMAVFLFLAGMRVDFAELRRQSRVATAAAIGSMALPFVAGLILAQHLHPRYGRGSAWDFGFFLAIAMSVTAFPVLARILSERRLLETPLGATAIAGAAFDDVTAWIMLALVFGSSGQTGSRPFWLGLVVFTALVAFLRASARWRPRSADPGWAGAAACAVSAALFAWSGDRIGIHPFSGAFLGGLAAPRHLRDPLSRRVEPLVLLLPVPVFFAITGLRTHLDLTHGSGIWPDLLLVVFVAIASKWAGTALGGRIGGASWRTALWLGALMNTRGLVELIVLNAGMERGILSPDLFSIMVSMALLTTFLTAPLLNWIGVTCAQEPHSVQRNAVTPEGSPT